MWENAEITTDQTVADLAAKMNVPQSNVSRLESGTRTPTLETLQRAAAALGVPLEIRFGSQIVALSGGK